MNARLTSARNGMRVARAAGLTTAILASAALLASPVASAATPAAKATVYNNVPAPLPGNVPSVGFEATAASEFGGQVQFAGTARSKPSVTLVLSSWGCENGYWYSGDCGTTAGATFSVPITVNVYTVAADNEPGTLVGSVTHTFNVPYRPSANYARCTGPDAGKWYSSRDATCYNGKAVKKTVALGSLDLPDYAIIGVAYNTTHYGYHPIGEATDCYTTSGGCGYDALNVGTGDTPASVGSQPLPDDAYYNSAQGDQYCDGGAGGVGTFRLDSGCWTGYQPAFRVKAN